MLLRKQNNPDLSNTQTSRIQTLDILRGIVITLMVLDHVRDFFHYNPAHIDPTDPLSTTMLLFGTRWITHICAPVFAWLTGVSAFLYAQKNDRRKTFFFLLSRGFILILLECTLVRFGWRFTFDYSSIGLLVIWALGLSMILLAFIQFVKEEYIYWLGLCILVFHNMLDNIKVTGGAWKKLLWFIVHQEGTVALTPGFSVHVLYPVLPMIGLMCLGHGMGFLYKEFNTTERHSFLKRNAWIFLLGFFSLKLVNMYGDPVEWKEYEHVNQTFFSFWNVTKYPMSLDYLLITMSIAFFILARLEKTQPGFFTTKLALFGKVSMFFYIIHLYVIHLLALLAAFIMHHNEPGIFSGDWKKFPAQFGYSLPVVYAVWILILILMYPLCRWYKRLKSKHPDSLLRFI